MHGGHLRTYSKMKEPMALAAGLPTIFQVGRTLGAEGLRATGSTKRETSLVGGRPSHVMAVTKMRFLRRRGRPRWLESLRRDSV